MYRFLVEMEDLVELIQQETQAEEVLEEIQEGEQVPLDRLALMGLRLRQEQLAHKQVEVEQQALELLVLT
jgi:hypothetical protein